MGGVSHATPARSVMLLPQTAQAHGQPLLEHRVGLLQLLKTQGDDVALEAGILEGGREGGWEGGRVGGREGGTTDAMSDVRAIETCS